MTTTSERPAHSRVANFSVWLIAGVLAINVLISTFTALSLLEARREYDEHAAQTTRNLALTLEREIAGLIRSSDIVLQTVIDEFHRRRQDGVVDAGQLSEFIDRQRRRFPYIDGVRLTDAEGILRYGTDVRPETRIDVSDRPHFKTLIDLVDDQLVISQPQKSRANNKSVIVFARRLNHPDGSFLGMAFVPVPVDLLTQTFSQLAIPDGGSITLRGFDMGIIARYPAPNLTSAYVGQTTVARELTDLLAAGARHGTYRATTPLDGIERVLSFRKVSEYPLYLVVGRATDEYLAPWRTAALRAVLTLALLLLLSTALSALAYRYWNKLARANATLTHLAHTDFLTQLMNRRAFLDAAEGELARARRYGTPMSVLVVDVDKFKKINDTLGHDAGDQALKQLAYRLRTSLREVDLVARWGGEEFIALLPGTDAPGALDLAERVRQLVAESTAIDRPSPQLTISVGIASLNAADESFAALVDRADAALYRAKNAGRNRVELAESPVLA